LLVGGRRWGEDGGIRRRERLGGWRLALRSCGGYARFASFAALTESGKTPPPVIHPVPAVRVEHECFANHDHCVLATTPLCRSELLTSRTERDGPARVLDNDRRSLRQPSGE
jgi:hypothetical protein